MWAFVLVFQKAWAMSSFLCRLACSGAAFFMHILKMNADCNCRLYNAWIILYEQWVLFQRLLSFCWIKIVPCFGCLYIAKVKSVLDARSCISGSLLLWKFNLVSLVLSCNLMTVKKIRYLAQHSHSCFCCTTLLSAMLSQSRKLILQISAHEINLDLKDDSWIWSCRPVPKQNTVFGRLHWLNFAYVVQEP